MYFSRKKRTPCVMKKGPPAKERCPNPKSTEKATSIIPIKMSTSTVKLFASRSRLRNISRTTAKISKYHVLENNYTGEDICCKIINTHIGLSEHYNDINFDNIIPILSPILNEFKIRHNKCNYCDKLKFTIERCSGKYAKRQKYKNQIHVRLLKYFFGSILYENIPLELFGTRQNVKAIKKTIHCLLKTVPRNMPITGAFKRKVRETCGIGASLDIQPLFNKLDITKIKWLHPIKSNTQRWIIILKLLHWFFAQYIVKILHKHVILVSVKRQWIYIGKDDWCNMQEGFIKGKQSTGGLVASVKSDESTWNPPIGIYKFIPSSSGLRALLITKCDTEEQFDAIDIVLRFLQQLYVTYFNEKGIPTLSSCQQAICKFKRSTNKKLYFVRCDIQDAFGSIIQEKLYDIIRTCCKQLPLYLVLRAYNLRKTKRKRCKEQKQLGINKVYEMKTVQFVDLKRSIHKRISIVKKKPKFVKKTKLVAKIKKLIFDQKVKINDKIYLIRSGVSQGVRVSSILADIYYQHMFKEIFSEYANNGLLITYVDDILYITENESYATEFLRIIMSGIPEYNVKFNASKIESNLGLAHKIEKKRQFDTSTSAGDDTSYFSSEPDLLNPRVTKCFRRSRRRALKNKEGDLLNLPRVPSRSLRYQHPLVNRQIVKAKLLTEEGDNIIVPQHISEFGSSAVKIRSKKYRSSVVFEERHLSEGEAPDHSRYNGKLWRLMHCTDNRKKDNTPRIVRAIRRNSSKKLDSQADRSVTSERPRAGSSKSSVILLYHGRSITPPSSSSKTLVQLSRSDQTVVETSRLSRTEVARVAPSDRTKIIETRSSGTPSPRYPLRRRKTSRRYRRVSRQRHSLNVSIFHENRVERSVSPLHDHWTASDKKVGLDFWNKESRCTAEPFRNSRESRVIKRQPRKHVQEERIWGRGCSSIEVSDLKSMGHAQKQVKAADASNRKQLVPCSSLAFLMQTRPKGTDDSRAFVSVNEGDETNRVFPFQATPSGNLKVIPNQVVFESKKFSVLVADPRRTKVNVKAELGRGGVNVEKFVSCSAHNRTKYIDLPPGITPSTIAQLQAQKRLPHIEANYNLQMQSYHTRQFNPAEMEQPIQATSHELSSMNQVPLASLGFTNEKPIDWDNIILPEKTDLYQELARRITNYKNADCIVRIDHDEFYCHLLVLQSYSMFFDEKNCKDIDLSESDVTSKAFAIIYDWMITPIKESHQLLRRDNILEIFMAAQYLGIKELEEQCWAFIDNDELFSEDTAFLLYLEAKKIGNVAVMELMVPRIMKFFLMLVSTKDFLELSVDELCLLLKSNYICVNSEMEVLMSAVRWLMHDWNTRKQYMLEVLKCVRFGLIAPWQLVDVKRNPENPEFMELMSYPEVQKMVDDGLAFVIIKYWYGNQTEDYYHWIELLGLSEPTNRNWAGEDKNYVTYREFLLYLEEYQKTKIPEFKAGKLRAKPSPPNSPPKDCTPLMPETHTTCSQNHCYVDSHSLEQCNTSQNRRSTKYMPKVEVPLGMAIQSETLTECLSNMGRSNNTQMVVDKPDYEGWQEMKRNAPNVHNCKRWKQNAIIPTNKQQKMTKKLRYPEHQADSAKSEEEAATMIQATYRGYKVRRRFDEIRKSSSEEKQNARKVAHLLSVPTSQCGWPFPKVLNLAKVSNISANQNKNLLYRN